MKNKPYIHSYSTSSDQNVNLSSRILLNRTPDPEYLQEWADGLRVEEVINKQAETVSVVVFRLGQEWLALQTACFKEIVEEKLIHRLPHQKNPILLGVVNLNGELQPCLSLSVFLGIKDSLGRSKKHLYHKNRMVAAMQEKNLWVFPVDEIDGIYLWDPKLIENVPVNISKSKMNYLKGIVNYDNRSVGILDEGLLFYSFSRLFA